MKNDDAVRRADVGRLLAFASAGIGYIAYLWLAIPALISHPFPDLHAPVLSLSDLAGSLARDFALCTLFPLVAFAFASRRMERIPSPSDEQRKRNIAILSIASLLIALIYVLFGQKTLDGLYEWLRYPLFVAQSEELLFRGVIFWGVYTCMGKV